MLIGINNKVTFMKFALRVDSTKSLLRIYQESAESLRAKELRIY